MLKHTTDGRAEQALQHLVIFCTCLIATIGSLIRPERQLQNSEGLAHDELTRRNTAFVLYYTRKNVMKDILSCRVEENTMKKIIFLTILCLVLASCAPITVTPSPTNTPTLSTTPTSTDTRTQAPPPTSTNTPAPVITLTPGASSIQHVFVVVMENHGYDQVWDTPSSPYITSLGNANARATNYHASIHPSLPNYLQLYGGSHYGITTDCNPSASCHVSAINLADNLEAKGLTWKGYMESMPSPCYLKTSGDYAPKHNPFVYFDDIRNNPARCNSHVVPYTDLAADLASAATTPNYAMISPNLCNDMHDCSVATGDGWLQSNLPAILNSPACTVEQCLLILTWDEDDNGQNNQVLTIFAGSAAKTGGVTSNMPYSHFSALRTVEDIFGLPTQTDNDAAASAMTDMLR